MFSPVHCCLNPLLLHFSLCSNSCHESYREQLATPTSAQQATFRSNTKQKERRVRMVALDWICIWYDMRLWSFVSLPIYNICLLRFQKLYCSPNLQWRERSVELVHQSLHCTVPHYEYEILTGQFIINI